MSDIGLSEDVKSDDISSSGLSGVQSFSDYSPSGSDGDNYAQATANLIAQPKVGINRSNIIGTDNYDPQFAAALQISRGLNPGVNTGGLDVPSYLQPQLTGDIASDFRGSYNREPKYYSPVERFMQTDLADFVQSAPSLTNLIGRGLDSLMGGIDFLNNSKAGKTVEEVAEEEKRIEIADLEKERLDSLVTAPIDRVKTSELDPAFMNVDKTTAMDAGASLASGTSVPLIERSFVNLPPDPVLVNQIQRDIAKSRGIFDLPQAADLQNQQIAAGASTGKTLNPELPVSFPYGRSGGYNLSALSSRGDVAKPDPVQGPPSPFFPDQITPTKRPFATTDEVALRSSPEGFYFANAFNRPLDASRTSEKYRTPINEEEARAEEFAAYNLSSIPKGTDPVEFINKRDLPSDLQGIVSLNRDLDYGSTIPLSYYFDQTARGKAEERARLETIRKAAEALANQPRFYSDSGTEGLPGLY